MSSTSASPTKHILLIFLWPLGFCIRKFPVPIVMSYVILSMIANSRHEVCHLLCDCLIWGFRTVCFWLCVYSNYSWFGSDFLYTTSWCFRFSLSSSHYQFTVLRIRLIVHAFWMLDLRPWNNWSFKWCSSSCSVIAWGCCCLIAFKAHFRCKIKAWTLSFLPCTIL